MPQQLVKIIFLLQTAYGSDIFLLHFTTVNDRNIRERLREVGRIAHFFVIFFLFSYLASNAGVEDAENISYGH